MRKLGSAFLAALLLSLLPFSVLADELVIHALHSPMGLSWRSPGSLARTTVRNSLAQLIGAPYLLGHVNVELKCEAQGSLPAYAFSSGMTDELAGASRDLILKRGFGLGILFTDFPGRLMWPEEVQSDLKKDYQAGRAAYLAVDVTPETCARLKEYQIEYITRKYFRGYGTPNRPRYGEGAGCSAYGASFLEVAGAMLPEIESNWSHHYRVPMKFIGGPYGTKRKRVSLIRLLAAFGSRWAHSYEDGLDLSVWDPDTIHNWIKTHARNLKRRGKNPFRYPARAEKRERGWGIRVDLRTVPTPSDPLFDASAPLEGAIRPDPRTL